MKITTEAKTEIKLKPELGKKLLLKLREYEFHTNNIRAAKHCQESIKAELDRLFTEAGELHALIEGVKTEGFSIKQISPLRSKFNKKKFVQIGGSLALIDQATELIPAKSYTKISCPNEKDETEDTE